MYIRARSYVNAYIIHCDHYFLSPSVVLLYQHLEMESEKDRGSNFGGGGEVEKDGEDEEEMEEVSYATLYTLLGT